MADYYGVPNGMIAPHVGMMIKGKPLDAYGDLLTTVCMPGGGEDEATRHDQVGPG